MSLAGGEKWDAFVAWDESRRSTVEGVSSGREEGNRRPTKQISFGDESQLVCRNDHVLPVVLRRGDDHLDEALHLHDDA